MRNKILKCLDLLSNIKWDLIFGFKMLFDREFNITIKSNIKLSGNHIGERCFIVGNGPSLKEMDLSKLESEKVFTVNNIMINSDLYSKLRSDYHIMIDPGYFILDPSLQDDKVTLDLLSKINYEDKKPVCIVNYDGKKAFERYGLDKCLDLNYIYLHKNLTDNYSKDIDLCSNIPSCQNVIHAALFSAISMGFKKIYLVGCDMTSVFLTYEANANGEVDIVKDFHAYEYTEIERERLFKDFNMLDNEAVMYDYAKTFTIFRRIRQYCERNNIKIYNATIGGGLDVFNRIQFSDIFENKE